MLFESIIRAYCLAQNVKSERSRCRQRHSKSLKEHIRRTKSEEVEYSAVATQLVWT